MLAGILASIRRTGIRSMATAFTPNAAAVSSRSTATRLFTSTASTSIVPRVKTIDATGPSDGDVVVKGWVRTVRKQKTLAFVEVNDGSTLSGIQCVLSFDNIDEATKEGMYKIYVSWWWLVVLLLKNEVSTPNFATITHLTFCLNYNTYSHTFSTTTFLRN